MSKTCADRSVRTRLNSETSKRQAIKISMASPLQCSFPGSDVFSDGCWRKFSDEFSPFYPPFRGPSGPETGARGPSGAPCLIWRRYLLQTLYTYPENFRAYKALVAAQYANANVKVAPNFVFGETNKTEAFLKKFPGGKVRVFF